MYGSDLVAGGTFTQAGVTPANRVAVWNGLSWSSLGVGVGSYVQCVQEYQGELVVAGTFSDAGGAPATRIARWDGDTWHPMGSGLDHWAYDLEVFQNRLYVVGLFTFAGGNASRYIARWEGMSIVSVGSHTPTGSELRLEGAFPNPTSGSAVFQYRLASAGTVQLRIYDVSGREVRHLLGGVHEAGNHQVTWDGRGHDGRRLPGGIYFARLSAGQYSDTTRLVLLR